MKTSQQATTYISSLPVLKQADVRSLHQDFLQLNGSGKLWFLDGKNEEGKVVTNPNIGYGELTMHYKDGSSREFYKVGLSANTAGISVYIMGIDDKNFLKETYGSRIGKATITGYCIKFKSLKDIDTAVLLEAVSSALQP